MCRGRVRAGEVDGCHVRADTSVGVDTLGYEGRPLRRNCSRENGKFGELTVLE